MKQIAPSLGLFGILLCGSALGHAQSFSDCDSLLPIQQIATIPYLGSITAFGDLNHNGNVEIVGLGPRPGDPFQTYYPKIFEYQGNNTYKEVYGRERTKSIETPWWIGDSDDDDLMEMLWTYVVSFPNPGGGFRAAYELLLFEAKDSVSYPAPPTDYWQQDSTARVIWRHVGNGSIAVSLRNNLKFADLDRDGKSEFFFFDLDTVKQTPFIDIWENSGNDAYRSVAQIRSFPDGGGGDITFGDFDGDDRTEIVVGSGQQVVRIFENTGDNSYEFIHEITMPTKWASATGYIDDADRNGKSELVIGGASISAGIQIYSVFESAADNQYTLVWRDIVPDFPFGTPMIRSGDIDGDGSPELVIYSEEYVRIYKVFGEHDFRCVWRIRAGAVWPPLFNTNQNDKMELFRGYGYDTDNPHFEVYEFRGSVAVQEKEPRVSPSEIILNQNYPNPFNAETFIQWAQIRRAHVQLVVFDSTGRQVRVLFDQIQEPGTHQIKFDGTGLASGVYFFQLLINGQVQRMKTFLLR